MTSSEAATGLRLARMGRYAQALPYLERANRMAPTDVALLHATASVLQWARRGRIAAERYRVAAALLPDDVGILDGWARALLLIDERDRALDLMERLLALDVHFADPHGALEMLLRETGDTACGLLQALIERQPSHPGLLRQYGRALLETERLQEAQDVHERLHRLRPSDPYPSVELGRLAVSHGDTVAARAHFQSALDADAGYAAALWELAQIDGWRIDAPTLARIHAGLDVERDPKARAGLHDIFARHHDRAGEYEAAAQHARSTNALMESLVPPAHRYDEHRHQVQIDQTLRDWTPALLARLHDAGNPERRPVFVIGLPRSGTTLLEQMLASHPGIVGVGEQALAGASLRRALATSGGSSERLAAHAVGEAAAWHLHMLDERIARTQMQRDCERIVDKMPDNYLLAGWLRLAFPNAAIIHCLRDPRDVAVSCWLTQFADVGWSHDLVHIAHRIEQHRRIMRHWRAILDGPLTEIRYERLIADPEPELRRALAAIGLGWDAGMLDFSGRGGFVASASRQQVREPLHARSVGRWRNYEQALEPILRRLERIAADDATEATAPDADSPIPA